MQDYEFSVLVTLYLFGKRLQALVKKHNTDVMSQSIILRLVCLKPCSVSDLASMLSIKVSAATSKVLELEKLGFVIRSEAKDKRSHMIEVTPKGKEQLQCIKQSMSGGSHGHSLGLTHEQALEIESLVGRIRLE